MIRTIRIAPLVLATLLLAAITLPALAGEEAFDLRVDLAIDGSTSGALQPGDVIRMELLPVPQYGVEKAPSSVVLERTVGRDDLRGEWRFTKALAPNQIYRVEMMILRGGTEARYLSALARLPRRAVDAPIPMRLSRGDRRDTRHTLVMLNKDADGVFRLEVFTA